MIALTDHIETVYGESDITATNAQIKNIQLKHNFVLCTYGHKVDYVKNVNVNP